RASVSASLSIIDAYPAIVISFNAAAPTPIYTLSLHDALPISQRAHGQAQRRDADIQGRIEADRPRQEDLQQVLQLETARIIRVRSEEHTSELQSLAYLVCRLLLEKKKNQT